MERDTVRTPIRTGTNMMKKMCLFHVEGTLMCLITGPRFYSGLQQTLTRIIIKVRMDIVFLTPPLVRFVRCTLARVVSFEHESRKSIECV